MAAATTGEVSSWAVRHTHDSGVITDSGGLRAPKRISHNSFLPQLSIPIRPILSSVFTEGTLPITLDSKFTTRSSTRENKHYTDVGRYESPTTNILNEHLKWLILLNHLILMLNFKTEWKRKSFMAVEHSF